MDEDGAPFSCSSHTFHPVSRLPLSFCLPQKRKRKRHLQTKSSFAPLNKAPTRYLLLEPTKAGHSVRVTLCEIHQHGSLVYSEYSEKPIFVSLFCFLPADTCICVCVNACECASNPHSYASASYQRPLCLIKPRSRFPFVCERQRRVTPLPSEGTFTKRSDFGKLFKTRR